MYLGRKVMVSPGGRWRERPVDGPSLQSSRSPMRNGMQEQPHMLPIERQGQGFVWNARPQTARQRSTLPLGFSDPGELEFMDDNETPHKRPLRSARWFRKDDLPGFVHRTTLAAAGWSREDLMTRPVIGILNTWSDMNPCNLNLRALAEDVRTGILEAGGIPFEIPLMSLSENIIKPTSFPFRNLLAMEVEETLRAHPFDAVVLLGGC